MDAPPATVRLCKVALDRPALPVMVKSGTKIRRAVVIVREAEVLLVEVLRLMVKLYIRPTVELVTALPVPT